jgi:hypothetical protein
MQGTFKETSYIYGTSSRCGVNAATGEVAVMKCGESCPNEEVCVGRCGSGSMLHEYGTGTNVRNQLNKCGSA